MYRNTLNYKYAIYTESYRITKFTFVTCSVKVNFTNKHYSTGSGSGSPVAGMEDKSGLTILLYSAKVLTGPSGVLSQPGLSIVSSKMPINGFPSGVISLN